ncbi:MAG: hypothetical protein H7222_02085 [Methylotenera sp.]|nr:hypothetical protein [Oligoflexia bacterium]
MQDPLKPSFHLNRLYELIVFDWDGTAVSNRSEFAGDLTALLESLLRAGVTCVIITGTSFPSLDAICLASLSPLAKKNLFVCTNRGSEVFSFDRFGEHQRVHLRQATSEEDAALDHAASQLKAELSLRGLQVEVIRDRLNRRKIDLIPVASWQNPGKSEFGRLFEAVEMRVKAADLAGLNQVIQLAQQCARQAGLPSARITSDIKHVEIGLTDKGDSVDWIQKTLMHERGFLANEMLFVGDELGPMGGLPGSDSLAKRPGLELAQFISVGVEPQGVPDWVLHVPGGPRKFLELLSSQIELRAASGGPLKLALFLDGWRSDDPAWLLEQEGFDATREGEFESLFTVGNGSLGIRGALSFPIPSSQSDLIVAGIYGNKAGNLPYSEVEFMTRNRSTGSEVEIVTFPSPFHLKLRYRGQELIPGKVGHSSVGRTLDMRTGVLFEDFSFGKAEHLSQLDVRTARMASLSDPELLLQEIEIRSQAEEPEWIELLTSCDDPDLQIRHPHLTRISRPVSKSDCADLIEMEVGANLYRVITATRMLVNGTETRQASIRAQLDVNHPLRVLRLIHIVQLSENPGQRLLDFSEFRTFGEMGRAVAAHAGCWRKFWDGCDLDFGKRTDLTEAQRFNSYHLRIAAPKVATASVSARGLSGRAYEGHIFWDAEVFVFPFLLQAQPELARNCLDYRYGTLNGAKQRAKGMGYAGACYAWESTRSGYDVTPGEIYLKSANRDIPIFTGSQQIHVTAGVAHAVWNYWQTTRDDGWMKAFGAEIMVETARFWASRVNWEGESYHIVKVVGPDEYHHDVDDNAYTNWMARFNLQKALATCDWLRKSADGGWENLTEKLKITPAELLRWNDVQTRLWCPGPNQSGVIEQFRGFFDLKKVELKPTELFSAPLSRLLNWEGINRSQVIKQADVLMIPFLFPSALSKAEVAANYDFYEPLTDHGSSLSPPVHAAIAAQISRWTAAEKFWSQSVHFDLLDLMQNTALGVHLGCMGAAWQALVFHILKARAAELPTLWTALKPRSEEAA